MPAPPPATSLPAPDHVSDARRCTWMKAAYFSYFVALPAIHAFGGIVLESKGFAPSTIGLMNAAHPVSALLIGPTVATLAESHGVQFPVLATLSIAASLFASTIVVSSSIPVVTVAALLFPVVVRPVGPLLDEHTKSVLGPERQSHWGKLRAYGGYGWATSAVVTGVVGMTAGWPFVSVLIMGGFFGAVGALHRAPVDRSTLPCRDDDGSSSGESPTHKHGLWTLLRLLATRPRVLAFFGGFACMGIGLALVMSFLFLFLKQELAPSPWVYGLSIVTMVVWETPVMRHSDAVYSRFTDVEMMTVAMLSWVMRALLYSVLPNPWMVLVVEPLHGFTFGFTWLCGMRFFPASFPKEFSASSVSLLYASMSGLGSLLGNVGGGYAFEVLGPRRMYQAAAAAMFILACVFYCAVPRLPTVGGHPADTGSRRPDEQRAPRPSANSDGGRGRSTGSESVVKSRSVVVDVGTQNTAP